MALKTYKDADGNEITVDDEVSLIGPPPQEPSPEAVNPASQPPQFWKTPETEEDKDWRTRKAKEPSGYGNPVDSPEFNKLWGSLIPKDGV